jgi:DNA-binding transcriptional regulator YdaS (Cro superfamily)
MVVVLSAEGMKSELMHKLNERGAQARVARALSISATTVNNWAAGRNAPERERWAAIEKALDMEPGTLAALSTPPGAGDLIGELRSAIRSLDEEVQHLRAELAALRAELPPLPRATPSPRRAARSTS